MSDNKRPLALAEDFPSEAWCLPPPIPGSWRELPTAEAALLVARLSETAGIVISPSSKMPLTVEAVRILPTTFYDGWLLCDIQIRPDPREAATEEDGDGRGPPFERAICAFLYGPDGFLPLAGVSGPIHAHNLRHGADLSSDEKRQDYLRFFCFAVHSDLGPFLIRETSASVDLSGAALTAEAKAEVEHALTPLFLEADTEAPEGTAVYRACVQYGKTLFRARFGIASGANVEMLDDDPLADPVQATPETMYAGCLRYLVAAQVEHTST